MLDDTPNHVRAKRLLDSFRPPSAPEGPQIRALLRDGSKSALINFNAREPPTVQTLRAQIWRKFQAELEAKTDEMLSTPEGELAAANAPEPVVASNFLLSFHFDGCAQPVDVEEDRDVGLLAEAVKVYGPYNVQCIVDVPFLNVAGVPLEACAEQWELDPLWSPRGLAVNQCHTPKKEKEKADQEKKALVAAQVAAASGATGTVATLPADAKTPKSVARVAHLD